MTFEEDLKNSNIIKLLKDETFANKFYGALCNTEIYSLKTGDPLGGYSWRAAGALIAELRNKGENYLDYYCNGMEGQNLDEVNLYLEKVGYMVKPI